MEPIISVVVPAYNRAHTLKRCIESVLNQEYKNWELLIVDDGSTDSSKDLVLSYSKNNAEIKWLERPQERPKGANACRNLGIENAAGSFVAMLDSDDELLPSKLKSDMEVVQNQEGKGGIYSAIIIDDGDDRVKSKSRALRSNESYVDFIFEKDLIAATSTYFLPREEAVQLKWDESLQRHQDLDYFIRYGKAFGWTFSNKAEVVVYWEKDREVKHDFDSMIQFYTKYGKEITNIENKANYLLRNWINANEKGSEYCNFYVKELRKIKTGLSTKYRIFRIAPKIIYPVWKRLK
ncbi:MAG: glycosyltransferase family 2 protein [Cyclobacteriaceae bacterium]